MAKRKRPQSPASRRPTKKGRRDRLPTEAELAAERDEVKPPIFGKGVSDIVPGEVVVQLREDTAARVTESIARGPRRGLRESGATSLGIDALDSILRDLKVRDIVRLHPPAPFTSASPSAGAFRELAAPMAATFRVSFAATTSVDRAVERLEAVDGVEFAEPNRYRETYAIPNDPSFGAQWGLTKINAPAAWDRTTGSANITVAVIDTGVDLDHPELAPLLVQGADMVDLGPNPTPPAGFRFEGDFQGRDNVPQDEVGHGTHVAGTIACLSNNGVGVAGVTWLCRLMPVKVLTRLVNIANPNDVRGTGSTADIAAGIRWAVDNGARVLNLSLGGTTDTQVERDAIAYAIARGAVVVAAMGNGSQQGNPTSFPAAYPSVVAVGAINAADARAAFSQTGPHIDVAAPGVSIFSTVWDNGYTNMSGTSMASPHVAGLAALILSCNGNLTGAQVADIIRQTARPLRDNPADPVPNNNYGFGCIDAQAAINRACPRRSIPILTCPRQSTIVVCERPTRPIQCSVASVQITCLQPSVVTSCPSVATICPSVNALCPSVVISTCQRISAPITCPRPTTTIVCPRPSITIQCPSGPVCGIGGRPPINRGESAAEEAPYDSFAQGGGDWSEDDPYAENYGG